MCISRRYPVKVLPTQGVINMRPAWLGRKGGSTGVALHQRIQQCLRLLQIRRIKAFGEPAIDGCQEVMGFLAFALPLPESSETCCCTEFERFGLLVLGYTDGVMEAVLRVSLIV